MRLLHLSLTNFRLYTRLELSLPEGPVLLYGANAQGKTSILEAIYYLATSRSPWTTSDRQMLNWRVQNDVQPFVRISAETDNLRRSLNKIDITLYKESLEEVGRFRKEIRVNGVQRRAMDLLGEINVVMFLPQDLAIIEGPPAHRRRYLNITLSQTDPAYVQALHNYEKALEQRNALLRQISKKQASPGELVYWDNELVTSGSVIISGRQHLLRELEGLAQKVHADLTGGSEVLELQYLPSFMPTATTTGQLSFSVPGLDLHRQLEPREIEPQFRATLASNAREEIARGITLVGPQRDELRFTVNGHDLGDFGSRGQARTAVIALKLAELGWMRSVTGEWPVLLLDELIAELDHERRTYLLDRIDGATQSILTTTEPDIFTKSFLSKAVVLQVQAGQINPAPIP
ncbi:MAG: DNA replication/repair protein RecF [Chloroflexota bacterium]